jgi:hypothetical protein
MALYVGLDVSLKMTSICIVDGWLVGMGEQSRKRAGVPLTQMRMPRNFAFW